MTHQWRGVEICPHLLAAHADHPSEYLSCLLGAVMPSDFVESVITDASVGTDPLGYAIAVTDDNVVTVHCTTDDTERDYAASSLQQYRGTITKNARRRANRHVQQVTIHVEVEDQNDSDDQQDATVRTEDSISCDDQHDPADAPVSEDDLGRIAQEAATAIAGVAHRSACMCCQRSVQDDSCTTVNLSTPAPSHYAVRLKVPDNADLPAGLVAFYLVTGDAIDESWSSLMLCQTSMFTSHDGKPCASLCEQCCGALKDRKSVKPPTMSIANGNWWGSASAIPELADLTESEWTFLTQGRCGTAAVRHETVVAFEHQVPISRDNADGTTVHPKRPKLTRHMVVCRATPAETLRRLQGCTAPALKVHIIFASVIFGQMLMCGPLLRNLSVRLRSTFPGSARRMRGSCPTTSGSRTTSLAPLMSMLIMSFRTY